MYKRIKIYISGVLIIASFAIMVPVLAHDVDIIDSILSKSTLKLKDNRPNRPVFKNAIPSDFESFMFKMTTLKTGLSISKNFNSSKNNDKDISNLTLEVPKPIDNVKIYPNPVADQLTLSYTLKKESLVTVKVLDVLGNEVITLLSRKLGAGEQTNTFILDAKLNSGFYFVRVIAGSDSIIKRISVL